MRFSKKVSVIVPVFNREWCIEDCLISVLNQTYKNFELIVVNDGSFDKTSEIIESVKLNHNNVTIINQENKGVSAARNAGIKACSGDYIAFLDSDDSWTKDKLETQIDFFEKNQEALVCQTDEIWIRNGKRINPKKRHKKPSGDIFIPSLSLCLVSPSAVMMKKEFFTKAGLFDESMIACEDYDLWLRGSLLFDFFTIEKQCVIKKGGHLDQLSAMARLDNFRIYSLNKILQSGISDKEKQKACIEKLMEKCFICTNGCKKRYKWEEYYIYKTIGDYWRKYL